MVKYLTSTLRAVGEDKNGKLITSEVKYSRKFEEVAEQIFKEHPDVVTVSKVRIQVTELKKISRDELKK